MNMLTLKEAIQFLDNELHLFLLEEEMLDESAEAPRSYSRLDWAERFIIFLKGLEK